MQTIYLKKIPLDYKKYVKRSALEKDYRMMISESTVIRDDDTGEVKVIYYCIPLDTTEVLEAVKKIKYQTTERSGGLKTTSRIFGYMPRIPMRTDACRKASLAEDFPKENRIISDYAKNVSEVYQYENPKMFDKHDKLAKKVLPDYKIEGSPFTSGIVNKNNPLKYHFDSGNFNDVFSCMIGFKQDVGGGHLALPEYGAALEIAPNSITIFDGQKIMHGVTPIRYYNEDAFRYTIVYYSLKGMWKCEPLEAELARIRNKHSEREMNWKETLGKNVK